MVVTVNMDLEIVVCVNGHVYGRVKGTTPPCPYCAEAKSEARRLRVAELEARLAHRDRTIYALRGTITRLNRK